MATALQAATRNSRGSGGSAWALGFAGISAVLASACCVLPLVLAIVGISGAWISRLRVLEPYTPWLVGLAIASLACAAWRLYVPTAHAAAACCAGDKACRAGGEAGRRWFWLVAVLALVPLVVPVLAPLFY